MIALLQRVSAAHVQVGAEVTGRIGAGLLVLLGVRVGDDPQDSAILARKVVELRIFEDAAGRMNRSIKELDAESREPRVLVVSQFTLCADLRSGRRPGFDGAERPERAVRLLELFIQDIEQQGVMVASGRFGATMDVHLVNHGPATFVLDSTHWRKTVDMRDRLA